MKRGKKYIEALKLIDRTKKYSIDEAVELVKKTSFVKFDATVEIAFCLNLDPRQAEQNLRGALVLPHGTGKVLRVIVVVEGEKAKEAEEAGADHVGSDELIEKISKGWFEFDVIVATPNMMGKLGKLGRILGPKGLMPNPKTGTVTMDVKKTVHEIKNGKIEYRVDKAGNIHAPVGRASFSEVQLKENIGVIYDQLARIKPTTVKGSYMKSITVSSSMGPGIRIEAETIKLR